MIADLSFQGMSRLTSTQVNQRIPHKDAHNVDTRILLANLDLRHRSDLCRHDRHDANHDERFRLVGMDDRCGKRMELLISRRLLCMREAEADSDVRCTRGMGGAG